MIVGYFDQSERFTEAVPGLKAVIAFAERCQRSPLPAGRYELEDAPEGTYAIVQTYDASELQPPLWEAHRQYLDVQCVLSGTEVLGWSGLKKLRGETAYQPEKDCLLAQDAEGASLLKLETGMFALLYPEDAHRPRCPQPEGGLVHKLVGKLPVRQEGPCHG